MPPLIRPLTYSLSLLLGLSALQLNAQDERWYQVELLIFSHETGSATEQWDALPPLNYPETGRFLVYPEQVESRQLDHDGISEVDELGRQFLRPDPSLLSPEDQQAEDSSTPDIPRPDSPATAALESPAVEGSGEEAELAIPLTPTPFIALPRRSAEFYSKAAYMQRTGQYKTLFHETWVQPVKEESSALPLIIDRSGDSGDWPRLQGSVKLHISRYLHIETNLWLNTQGQYLPGEWRMPAPPLGPVSLIIEEPEPTDEEESDPYFPNEESPLQAQEGELTSEALDEEDLGPIYPWRHAVLLQQKRRMRSKEVHYIDHPMLGVVIKFMPLDEEALQAMADAEFALEPESAQ